MKSIIIQLILLLFLAGACSSGRRTVSINSSRPADITVDQSIQSLVILNRTKYSKEAVNVLEGILTGELPEEDKAAIQSFIIGFQNRLANSGRFETRVANETFIGNSLTQAFPDPLPWSTIRVVCENYDADAVIAIEMFDSDFIITDGKSKKTVKNEDGEEIEIDEFSASGVANITIGVRIYDPISEKIIDQDLYRRTNEWNAQADTKSGAIAALINKTDATRHLTNQVGSNYAYKIAPMPVQITRSFIGKSKKSPALEQGSRYADVGNWKEAARIWENGLTSVPSKEGGYLTYNLAVANEILGNLNEARKWAERSYTQYGNNDARNYIQALEQRLENEQLAEKQMGN
ncbi:DUF6340 family protein [Ekhidna sp.]|uniref:DUF6340 family protein n=1 Tax=Ekhidna sp. TaxID=2608089 RepID=UPI003BAA68CB